MFKQRKASAADSDASSESVGGGGRALSVSTGDGEASPASKGAKKTATRRFSTSPGPPGGQIDGTAAARVSAAMSESIDVLYAVFATFVGSNGASDEVIFDGSINPLHARGLLLPLLEYALRVEVQACVQETTLFRERGVFVLFFAALARREEALKFIDVLVTPLSDALLKATVMADFSSALARVGAGSTAGRTTSVKAIELEIDPNKIEGPDNIVRAAQNALKLQDLSRQLLDMVLASLDQCPPTLRFMLVSTKKACDARFPLMSARVMCSLFFLRFLLPALCSPDKYGLGLMGSKNFNMPPEVRSALVKISKLIQAYVNDTRFAPNDPEAMFNGWLGKREQLAPIFAQLVMDKSANLTLGEKGDVLLVPKGKGLRLSLAGKRDKVEVPFDNALFNLMAERRHVMLAKLQEFCGDDHSYDWMLEALETLKT